MLRASVGRDGVHRGPRWIEPLESDCRSPRSSAEASPPAARGTKQREELALANGQVGIVERLEDAEERATSWIQIIGRALGSSGSATAGGNRVTPVPIPLFGAAAEVLLRWREDEGTMRSSVPSASMLGSLVSKAEPAEMSGSVWLCGSARKKAMMNLSSQMVKEM